MSGCVRQTTKKYLTRPSPAYPANLCCGMKMVGNDSKLYISVEDKNGVCKWIKVKDSSDFVKIGSKSKKMSNRSRKSKSSRKIKKSVKKSRKIKKSVKRSIKK